MNYLKCLILAETQVCVLDVLVPLLLCSKIEPDSFNKSDKSNLGSSSRTSPTGRTAFPFVTYVPRSVFFVSASMKVMRSMIAQNITPV